MVVDVRFHHELVTQCFPKIKVQRVEVGLAFRSLCRDRDVGVVWGDSPVGTRGDRVCSGSKISGKQTITFGGNKSFTPMLQ